MDDHDVLDLLWRTQNGDGGWGYYAGKASRLEPTCWAALATRDPRAVARLRTWPSREGLLLERDGGSVNVAFQALAVICLVALSVEHAATNAGLATGLAAVKGVQMGASDIARQDNDLQGWPWLIGTFSWVEPTSWAILALRKWHAVGGAPDASRTEEGVRLLLDRVCREGGWNYGNSNMLGAELIPHAPTTAIALLALQGHQQEESVRRSVTWLARHAARERAGMTLALTALALEAHGRGEATQAREAIAPQRPVTLALGNVCSLAASHLASTTDGPHPAFTV